MPRDLAGNRLGEGNDAALGRRVDGLTARADTACIGGDRDDLAGLLLDHVTERRPRAGHRAAQVDGEDLVPELGRGLNERHRLVPAGAVDQDVQSTGATGAGVDGGVDGGDVGDVERLRGGHAARLLDLGGDGARAGRIQIGDRHAGALAGEGVRDAAPDAAGGAGDERRTPVELHRTSALAMMSFMISLVPPPMVMSRASRAKRSTGYSRM